MPLIQTATSGAWSSTATWTGGVVPVLGDSVIVRHPGTNGLNANTQYRTATVGYAIGATSIALTGGTGTIAAGECVQFDGDPAYYRVATGIAAPGRIVIDAPGLLRALPASAVPVTNRGHVVTIAGNVSVGDDTSSAANAAANAVVVRGTLQASRSVASSFTCRGTLYVDTMGTLDYGVPGLDPIANVTATLILNDSASLAIGKHGLVAGTTGQLGMDFRFAGKPRRRLTRLSAAVAALAQSFSVDDATGWEVGDRIAIASDTDDATRMQIVVVTGLSGVGSRTVSIAPATVTNARLAGTRVGNLSSNVVIRPASANHPSFVRYGTNAASTVGSCQASDVRLQDMGSSAGWANIDSGISSRAGILVSGNSAPKMTLASCAYESSNTLSARAFALNNPSMNRHEFADWAIVSLGGFDSAAGLHSGCGGVFNEIVVFRCAAGYASNNSDGAADSIINNGAVWAGSRPFEFNPSVGCTINNPDWHTSSFSVGINNGQVTINGGQVTGLPGTRLLAVAAQTGSKSVVTFQGTAFNEVQLTGSVTTGSLPAQGSIARLIAVNGVVDDNRVISYYVWAATDAAVRKNGAYSARLTPQVANLPITYTFTLNVTAGVPAVVKGNLRFDSTYGTATPPSITITGQGVNQAFAAPAVANAWHEFTFGFTPAATGEVTVTVTMQSTSTAGSIWLDGLYHFPMIQRTRWYGFQYTLSPFLTADPVVQLSEAAAGALSGIAFAGGTLTVSGTRSIREIYDWLKRFETTNQVNAIITSTDGVAFSLAADLSITSTGRITGTGVIDLGARSLAIASGGDADPFIVTAAGRRVKIVAPALIAGSRVQVFNVTDGVELLNTTLAGDGLSLPATWTADKVIRLRADHSTKLALEVAGVLSSSGLSFLDTQQEDTVYIGNAIDGATCTEFSRDGVNIQVDINDPDGITQVQRLYAWLQWYQTTAAGIASSFFGAVAAIDSATYVIDQARADIKLDNVGGAPVRVTGGYLARKDGSTIIAPASGSIQMDPGKAYVAPIDALTVPAGQRLVLLQDGGRLLARG